MAAIQQFQPDNATEADDEYRAIEATLLESARGRWFLAEHGRRARRLDSALLEDAIGRLQNSIRQPPALLGQLQSEVEIIRSKIEQTRSELLQRPPSSTGESSDESGDTESSSAASGNKTASDWQPMDKMLAAAEEIHEKAWALQEKDIDPDACEAIARQAGALYALSMHQAAHSTRILNLADALDGTSAKIEGILQTISHELQIDSDGDAANAEPEAAADSADAGEPAEDAPTSEKD